MPASRSERGPALTVCALLFTLLAVSNLLKPLRLGGEQTGFVLFGERLSGTANAIAGPLFAAYLLFYAAGIWGMRRFALPMAYGYAAYVVVNLILYTLRTPQPPGMGPVVFGIVYSTIAIGVSSGSAYLLAKRKAELT
jgi:hypothetical protein